MSKKSPTTQEWKDAVWDYLIEHSDVTENGALFVKFHTSSRYNFENRIKARAVYGYHRDDNRLNMTTREKEALHLKRTKEHQVSKETRKMKWKAGAEERREVFRRLKEQQDRMLVLNRYPKPLRPLINTLLDTYATARMKVIQWKQVVLCRLRYSTATRPRKK